MPDPSPAEIPWSWREGRFFDPMVEEWLELHYVPAPEDLECSFIVAYLSRPTNYVFTAELHPENLPDTVDPGPIMSRIRQELDFFLIELREKDPFKYLRHHASTASNAYGQLQWFHCVVE